MRLEEKRKGRENKGKEKEKEKRGKRRTGELERGKRGKERKNKLSEIEGSKGKERKKDERRTSECGGEERNKWDITLNKQPHVKEDQLREKTQRLQRMVKVRGDMSVPFLSSPPSPSSAMS